MPRRARLRLAGYPIHLLQRGNNHSACFLEPPDYFLFLGLLNELGRMHSCAIHAYVLMTNHVHLLLTSCDAEGPSFLMKDLGQRYVQHFNKSHKRTGSLWEGRFRSSIVDTEDYLFTCQRYIELNPVRAGMVAYPSDYPWSSHRANAGHESSLVVVPHPKLSELGPTKPEREAKYRELFHEPLSNEDLQRIRASVCGGFALGSPAFVAEIEQILRKRAARGRPGRPRKRQSEDGKTWSVPGFTEPAGGGR